MCATVPATLGIETIVAVGRASGRLSGATGRDIHHPKGRVLQSATFAIARRCYRHGCAHRNLINRKEPHHEA